MYFNIKYFFTCPTSCLHRNHCLDSVSFFVYFVDILSIGIGLLILGEILALSNYILFFFPGQTSFIFMFLIYISASIILTNIKEIPQSLSLYLVLYIHIHVYYFHMCSSLRDFLRCSSPDSSLIQVSAVSGLFFIMVGVDFHSPNKILALLHCFLFYCEHFQAQSSRNSCISMTQLC